MNTNHPVVISANQPGTAVITIEEFERLRSIERQFNELTGNMDSMILSDEWYYNKRIINPDQATKLMNERVKHWMDKYYELCEKEVPMFNFRLKKVKDL